MRPGREEILERLARCLPRPVPGLSAETELSRLGLDSVEVVGLLCSIESEFGCEVGPEAVLVAGTVGEVTEIVMRSLESR